MSSLINRFNSLTIINVRLNFSLTHSTWHATKLSGPLRFFKIMGLDGFCHKSQHILCPLRFKNLGTNRCLLHLHKGYKNRLLPIHHLCMKTIFDSVDQARKERICINKVFYITSIIKCKMFS
jgi:hypothetical protein